jgi:hypothetical protein
MKKKTPKANKAVNGDPVEIVFDFTKIELFTFFDLMEMSANAKDGAQVGKEQVLKMITVLRSAFVSSSRTLTVADFEAVIESFWKQAEFFKNPNA